MSLRRVVALIQSPLAPFELGVVHEVFGVDRTAEGVPEFDLVLATEDPDRPVCLGGGGELSVEHDLSAITVADLVVVPSGPRPGGASPAVLAALREVPRHGTRVLGTCTGVFTLAEAGLLEDGAAAVHWRHADELARTYPSVTVDRESLYRTSPTVVTSAGTAAGVDACLHLVREAYGHRVANRIARRMVSPPHRSGGQLQYLERPVPRMTDTALDGLLTWLEEHVDARHSVSSLADRAHLSSRTLTRRFREDLGTSPMAWITSRRVVRAQVLLETTELSLHEIARRVGFSDENLMRHHFRAAVGATPSTYRVRFRPPR